MKYFNLSPEEITLMRILTRKRFLPYMLSFIVSLLVIFVSYLQVIKNSDFRFMPASSFLILSAGLVLALFLVHFLYTTGIIQTILKKNQKVIYSGVLAEKKIKENSGSVKYVFYMDGMKFSVKEPDFHIYNSGDPVEFHVSRSGKHLIKITKPSSETAIR
jgi:hypothetical protein